VSDHPVEIPDLPAAEHIDRLVALLEPLRRITQPKVLGIDNPPEDGSLLVGNHTIYGFLDLPFMMAELWAERRLPVRGLGEHAHYRIPLWRDLLKLCGMVRGTRDNVRALMRDRHTVLVFPGGAREVNKRRGEKYRLIWKERIGFARLAIEYGYGIVPFAAVGAEEMLDVVADDTTPGYAQLAELVEAITGWPLQPMVRGVGLTPIPRPERLYFWFGEPIDTKRFAGRDGTEAGARALRDEVRDSVEAGIELLLEERERDPDRGLLRRLRP
jgi:1-acyl-sn-glycerol-3-phosphate acyltransferase